MDALISEWRDINERNTELEEALREEREKSSNLQRMVTDMEIKVCSGAAEINTLIARLREEYKYLNNENIVLRNRLKRKEPVKMKVCRTCGKEYPSYHKKARISY